MNGANILVYFPLKHNHHSRKHQNQTTLQLQLSMFAVRNYYFNHQAIIIVCKFSTLGEPNSMIENRYAGARFFFTLTFAYGKWICHLHVL